MFPQRRNLLALSLSLAVAAPLLAQDKFPAKPVTIIVPFAAGGTTDILARIVGGLAAGASAGAPARAPILRATSPKALGGGR